MRDEALHAVLRRLERENAVSATGIVFPESTDFGKYRVIVVPPLYVASDELLNRLRQGNIHVFRDAFV
jgi:hypothetical protein